MKGKVFIAVVLALHLGMTAFAREYNDPSGFSFTYPEGWVPLNKMNLAADKLPPELNAWIARNNVNLDQINVSLVRQGRADFLESLNVVVIPQELSISEKSLKEYTSGILAKYRDMGVNISNVDSQLQTVGENEAIVMGFQSTLPAIPFKLQQRQVCFSGGGKTFIVTCTAKADTFANYAPTFDSILAGFKIPESESGSGANRILMFAIVGGVIGLVIAIVKKFVS